MSRAMNSDLQNLAEVVVRLQRESIRVRSILENIPEEHRCGRTLDDIVYCIDTASGNISDIIFELSCSGKW